MPCRIRLLVLVLALFGLAGCSRSSDASSTQVAAPSRRDFSTPWQDESQYIVHMVAANLAEMWQLAAEPAKSSELSVTAEEKPGADVLTYHVTITFPTGNITCDLPLHTAIWAPATYAPLTDALARRHALTRLPRDESAESRSNPLTALLTPTAEVLADTDITLSHTLESRLTDAALHHEAALLLGAFALRESSGKFYQIRDELCGMTAHLAFAARLDPADDSPSRRLAEATLALLCNNQTESLALLAPLPDAQPFGAWKTALRLRATRDYRLLADPSTATLLERREGFYAKAGSLSAERAWNDAKLDEPTSAQADWYRILAEQPVPIRLGHLVLRAGLATQLRETATVFARETGRESTQETLILALDTQPSRFAARQDDAAQPRRIIGWGRWAAASQRQLCHLIEVNFDFMQNRWGVRDQAAEFRDTMDSMFGRLRLYPFVRRLNSTQKDYYRAAQDDSRALMLRAPEIVPAEIWNYTCYTVKGCELYIPAPHGYVNEWHRHNPPPGTAYNPLPRMNQPSLTNQPDIIQRMETLHRLAPYDTVITHNLLRLRDGQNQIPANMAEAYRDVIEYNPMPNRRIARASAGQPAEYEKWMLRAAAIDPTDLRELAKYHRQHNEEEKAAATYIAWLKVETDEVAVANDAWFLVDYFENHQRFAEATALANRAAEAYSFDGLLTKADLLERRGRLDEALAVHRQLDERYGSPEQIIGFLWRAQKTRPSPRFTKELDTAVRAVLPGGVAPFKTEDKPPTRGVIVGTETDQLRQCGLRQGDIVVAARGYQVENWQSFKILRALNPREPYVIKVWRDGILLDLPPLDPRQNFGVNLEDYRTR